MRPLEPPAIRVGMMFALILGLSATAAPRSISQVLPEQRQTKSCSSSKRGSSEACPLPLRFETGAYGVLVTDRLNVIPQTRYYSLKAKAGQRLTLTFAGAGDLRAGITFPGESGDGPFSGEGNAIALPTAGTYILYISQNTMSGQPWKGTFSLAAIVR